MKILFCLFLASAVFISAVEVVINQHMSRKYFVEIQELEKTHDDLIEEWGRLQLEQSTWATDDRIESTARTKLGMVEPDINTMVLMIR